MSAQGLITFPQALGINIGATLGTTSTPWLVAIFGFRIRIALVALPILGIGAFLWTGESVTHVSQTHAIRQIDQFLESISLDTIDPSAMERRLVRLCHAVVNLPALKRTPAA